MENASTQPCLVFVLATVMLVLQGCGGGNGADGVTTTTRPPTTVTTTTSLGVNSMGCGDHCDQCEHGWCKKCKANYELTGPNAQCLFQCDSAFTIKTPVAKGPSKGLCLDDTTFLDCPSQIPSVWPNTNEPVQSIRMFKAWGFGDGWTDAKRKVAWDALARYTKSVGDRSSWEVQLKNEWTPYDAKTQQKIAQAEQQGQTIIRDHEGTQDYNIDLKHKVQTNIVTNVTHPIRQVNVGGVKILIGTQITCNETEDDADWENVKALMAHLGGEAVMGVAVGNELELLSTKGGDIEADCIQNLWAGGYLWKKMQSRFSDLNKMEGFDQTPITSVFGGLALAGAPFIDTPQAQVLTFLKQVVGNKDMYARWVFTFNFYPYFDPNMPLDPGSSDQCTKALAGATCWDSATCNVPATAVAARKAMQELTHNTDDVLWLGETGWSYPMSETLNTHMAHCPAWSSRETFLSYYEGFLGWDMEIEGTKPPDHVFYFTMRDSINFGHSEHFGLGSTCEDTSCKLQPATLEFQSSAITV